MSMSVASTVLAVLLAASLLLTGLLLVAWLHDRRRLRQCALEVIDTTAGAAEQATVLTHWVYHNQGFAKNKRGFLLARLGPTPLQVLEHGGDCADKSRLLSALLAEIGVKSGLVMIFSPQGAAIHTVVEAEVDGRRIVLDPVWDVVYAEGERCYGVQDMVGSRIGHRIAGKLVAERGPASKVALMPASEMCFDYAKPVNFAKGPLLPLLAKLIDAAGGNHRTVFRPRLLEDPKRFFVFGAALGSFGLGLLYLIAR